jgi:hypothetical protein
MTLKQGEKDRVALEGAKTGKSGVALWQVQDHAKSKCDLS